MDEVEQFLFDGNFRQDIADVAVLAAANAIPANLYIFRKIGADAVIIRNPATMFDRGEPLDIFLRYITPEDSHTVNAPHYDAVVLMTREEIEAEQLRRKPIDAMPFEKEAEIEKPIDVTEPKFVGKTDEEQRILDAKERKRVYNVKRTLNYPLLASVESKVVESIPWDIDGNKIYVLNDITDRNWRVKIEDGRSWEVCHSTTKELHIVRRFGKCNGAYICMNEKCSKFTSEGLRNITDFKKNPLIPKMVLCQLCEYQVVHKYCDAIKVYDQNRLAKTMTVYHQGDHICIPKPNRREKRNFILENMNVGALRKSSKEVQLDVLSQHLSCGDIDKAYEVVEMLDDKHLIEKMRYTGSLTDKMNRTSLSDIESFTNIIQFKTECDKRDTRLIYKVCCTGITGDSNMVFKSSSGACQMALKMDMANQEDPSKPSSLTEGRLFMDALHSRTKDYKTMGLYLEHDGMRSMQRLAVMDCQREDTQTIVFFLETFNNMLAEFKGDNDYKFNPHSGFLVDEAGCNMNAINKVYGIDMLNKTCTDFMHFFKCARKHSIDVPVEERASFEDLYKKLKQTYILSEFTRISDSLDAICNRNNLFWWDWWKQRRAHIVPLWRGMNTPGLNLAEVGHRTLKQTGKKVSLTVATWRDVLQFIVQDHMYKNFLTNEVSQIGRGQTVFKRRSREMAREKAFTKQACSFLSDATVEDVEKELDAIDNPETFLPNNSAKHRAPKTFATKNVPEGKKVGAAKKKGTPITRKRKAQTTRKPQHQAKRQKVAEEANIEEFESNESEDDKDDAVPEHLDRIEKTNNPTLVFLEGRRAKCYGCNAYFNSNEKTPPRNVLFSYHLNRTWMKDGQQFVSPYKSAAYFHALDFACMRRVAELMKVSGKDIYLCNDTFRRLTPGHVALLRERKLWNYLIQSRERVRQKGKV